MSTTEPNTAQSIVDGQLAELQITSAEVTGETYKEQHDAKIKALAEEEAALPAPTDKASLQVVQDFITKSEKARTGIDKWRKAFKDQWKRIIDPVDTYIGTNKESGMQARLFEIQQRAEAKKKAYLDERAKAQREADRLLEERYTGRVAKLLEAGMTIEANGNLTIRDGEQVMTAQPAQIRFSTDEQMGGVLAKVATIRDAQIEREAAALQAKEAEERERQEEAERLAQQKREQDEAAAKLKADREQLEKDRAEMRKAKNDMRFGELETLGAHLATEVMERGFITRDGLGDLSDEYWTALKTAVRDAKVKAIEEQNEAHRQKTLCHFRGEELKALGAQRYPDASWHIGVDEPGISEHAMGTMTSDEWAPVLARFKEAAEARDNQPAEDPDQWKKDGRLTNPNPGPVTATLVEFREVPGSFPVAEVLQQGSAVDGAQPVVHEESDVMAGRTNGAAPVDEFSGEPLTCESAIFQALGEASMCWDPRPTGIFDSTRAKEIGDRLVATIERLAIVHN